MEQLWVEFLGYMRIYQSRIIPVFLLSVVLGMIFLILVKTGYTKYAKKPVNTTICGLFLFLSVAVVLVMAFYGRTSGDEFVFRLRLFGSYIEALRCGSVEMALQIIMNIAMFIPLGLLLPCCFRVFEKNRFVFLTTLFFSGSIELIQGFARIGMFELDDILGNVLGAEIGWLIYRLGKSAIVVWRPAMKSQP